MKQYINILFGLVLFCATELLLTGCYTHRIDERVVSEYTSLRLKEAKSIVIVGTSDIHYSKPALSLEESFGKISFVDEYLDMCKEELSKMDTGLLVTVNKDPMWEILTYPSLTKGQAMLADSLFSGITADLFLRVYDFWIEEKWSHNKTYGPNNKPIDQTQRDCFIIAHYQLVDVKTNKVLLNFYAGGKYATTEKFLSKYFIRRAMGNSAYNARKYISHFLKM